MKLETPKKDSQGKKIETKGEETTGLLRNKVKKTVLDKLKAHEKESKLNGKAANLKKFLHSKGIYSQFGGGYCGSACDSLMSEEVLKGLNEILKDSPNISSIIQMIRQYRPINAILSMTSFTPNSLNNFNSDFNVSVQSFDSLVEFLQIKCRCWAKDVVLNLPYCRFNHYMHEVTAHAHQLMKRDHGINLHSSSGIEKSHQKMKKDVRRHLGAGPWAQTLLFRWLKRTDPAILSSKPRK